MKILILTQWFEPEPTFKGLLFARELAARGHEVEVLTGFPNYPDGEVYPGYRIRPWVREQIDSINVVRVALYPSHNNCGLHRALNYISFAVSAAVIGTALIRKPDVIYVYHPPITVGFAAAVIGFLRRTPFVYDVQDLWPDTVAASGMMSNTAALTLLGKMCKFIYRRARHIAVLSQGFKEQLVDRGIPSHKIDVIYNWCDEAALKQSGSSVRRLGATDRFCILFAGTMGRAQDLDSVLRAAQLCRTTAPAAEFLFMGGGVERGRLESMAKDMELDNVRFLPRQPIHAMGGILAGADALLVHLKDRPLFRITIPSKTQAYLAAGKPILMGVRGDAADLVERAGSGIVCEPGNPQSIAEAVRQLVNTGKERLAEMGRAGRAFYERELSVSVGVEKFDRVLKMAAQRTDGLVAKRLFDLVGAATALVVLSPLLLIVAAIVKIFLGSPVLFRQVRPGYKARPFTCLKFRTMRDASDSAGRSLPDADRLTSVGIWIRKLSLDELPQLWNVLRGDMSLVGPRPLLMRYLPYFTENEDARFEAMPGLTGLAQVNGRNSLTWDDRLAMDVNYVNKRTLLLDLKILAMTVLQVVRREGLQVDPGAAMLDLDEQRKRRCQQNC
jgi:lipopolysaccharide/colanic/teichoic acid biosynthesis glycosyltransferase